MCGSATVLAQEGPRERRMRGSATVLVQDAPDVWQCHVSRAGDAGCVAVPLFSRGVRGMRGSATLLVQQLLGPRPHSQRLRHLEARSSLLNRCALSPCSSS